MGHEVCGAPSSRDNRVLRLISKWLQAGVSEDGKWTETTVGTPQGAVITPRTQKITWVGWGGRWTVSRVGRSRWAAGIRLRMRHANRMPNGDRLPANKDVLHQQAENLLALGHVQGCRPLAQSCMEVVECFRS